MKSRYVHSGCTTMDGVLKLAGYDLVWDVEPKTEEAETPKPEVID